MCPSIQRLVDLPGMTDNLWGDHTMDQPISLNVIKHYISIGKPYNEPVLPLLDYFEPVEIL